MNDIARVFLIGIGATATADLWGLSRQALLGVAPPDYRLVGRWVGHMRHGRFRHESMAKAGLVRGEHLIGWGIHYATGIAFAALLLAIAGRTWLKQPTLWPAIAVGIGTVLAPFLVMQPAMGAGIAARASPRPNSARLHSLAMHTAFGLGLYATAVVLQKLQIN